MCGHKRLGRRSMGTDCIILIPSFIRKSSGSCASRHSFPLFSRCPSGVRLSVPSLNSSLILWLCDCGDRRVIHRCRRFDFCAPNPLTHLEPWCRVSLYVVCLFDIPTHTYSKQTHWHTVQRHKLKPFLPSSSSSWQTSAEKKGNEG